MFLVVYQQFSPSLLDTLSVKVGTNDSFIGSASDASYEEEVRAYDISYSYPINGSTTIVPFF